MLNNIRGFHLELTNKCTLKCPRCARTRFIDKFGKTWENENLNLEYLKQFLDIDLHNQQFLLCGNYGDPIYYNDLFDLIIWLKLTGADIHIVTNGSYRTANWWEELAGLLGTTDSVTFSIDGTPDNFTQYRINADWESMLLGIDIITKSSAKTIWKYIPFSYNINSIEPARQLSQELGFTEFQLDPSDRWDNDTDWLKPKDLIGERYSSIIKFRNKETVNIAPKCTQTHSEHYISSEGFYVPCCYAADYRFYYKSDFHKNRDRYNISKTTLSTILQQDEFYSSIKTTKPEYCTFNCPQL